MRTPRSGRLGLLGVGAVFALVASALSPVTANAAGPTTFAPGLTMTKTWSGSVERRRHRRRATITLTTPVAVPAARPTSLVDDIFDPGLDVHGFTSRPPAALCVRGQHAGLPPGHLHRHRRPRRQQQRARRRSTFTGDYWGYATYTKNYQTDERLDIQKAETHVDIQSGQYKTATVHCPAGYDLLDHSFVPPARRPGHRRLLRRLRHGPATWTHNSATVHALQRRRWQGAGQAVGGLPQEHTNHGNPVVWHAAELHAHRDVDPDGSARAPVLRRVRSGLHAGGDQPARRRATGSSDSTAILHGRPDPLDRARGRRQPAGDRVGDGPRPRRRHAPVALPGHPASAPTA